jgi:hypothetical protein
MNHQIIYVRDCTKVSLHPGCKEFFFHERGSPTARGGSSYASLAPQENWGQFRNMLGSQQAPTLYSVSGFPC